MAKVNVAKGEYLDPGTGEVKVGYRHPTTHQLVFDDVDSVEVEAVAPPEPAPEPETVEVEVDDQRFENLPEADEE